MRTLLLLLAAAAATLPACTRAPGGDRHADPPPADSVVLERLRCFGVCPAYRVSVAASGAVHFASRNQGDSARVEADTVSPDDFTRLLAAAERAGFDSLPARIADVEALCRLRATDHPTVIVSIHRPAGTKRVEDYTGCYVESNPPSLAPALMPLRVFETEVDRVAGSARWARPAKGK